MKKLLSQPGFHIVTVKSHLEELFQLDTKIFNSPPILTPFNSADELLNHLTVNHKTTTVILNNEEGIFLGYMSYQKVLEVPNLTELVNIGILPQFRRKGYGDKFMQYYLNLFKDKNSRLVTHPGNTSAKKLYEKYGYVPVKILSNYYGIGEHRILYFRPSSNS